MLGSVSLLQIAPNQLSYNNVTASLHHPTLDALLHILVSLEGFSHASIAILLPAEVAAIRFYSKFQRGEP
jgi:hypothetical protein